jgi:argininosuccinate synthase
MERIVLAYSGDLDTTVAIPWLRDKYHADVIALIVDIGQGGELDAVRKRALAAGAARAHVLDAREEFASGYVLRALQADASGDQPVGLTSSLGRALVVSKLVEVAGMEHSPAMAHGCHAEGSVRFDVLAHALNPALKVVAPAREWATTRAEQIEYAKSRDISVPPVEHERTDASLWGRSVAGGVLDDAWTEPPERVYTLTKPAAACPDAGVYVEVAFDRGVPTAINGVEMPILELIASLTTIAAAHGVGRIDAVRGRPAGLNPRIVHEAPAAVILHQAHAELQQLVTSRDADSFSRIVGLQYREAILDGQWFSPLREALDAYVKNMQEHVTGTVRLKLFKGTSSSVGRRSPNALVHSARDAEKHDKAPGTVISAFGRPGASKPPPVGTR